ncbi:Protein of unknown function (DUF3558) [Goodfellowiella coeruleoviolacea]|uniref:DUF3558 domain-containing protein n=2 Tax=Goodfellowiella coeruleoviolacea TaxID=334858 RepID=A0AAE3GD32_9PSEU|nr:Protein of unknown function (DUF3558) [Goodfellowiella coeruleoviolacea]
MVTFPPAGTTLDRYYKNKAQYPAFEESEVANYPAANFDITDAKHGQCSTIVGVAKDAVFIVQASAGSDDPQYSTPCTLSAKAAEIVVNNLKGDR